MGAESNYPIERKLFMEALQRLNPEVYEECTRRRRQIASNDVRRDLLRGEVNVAARDFFTVTNEANWVRPLAVQWDLLPPSVGDILETSIEELIVAMPEVAQGDYDFLKPAYCEMQMGSRVVRGTDIPFPENG